MRNRGRIKSSNKILLCITIVFILIKFTIQNSKAQIYYLDSLRNQTNNVELPINSRIDILNLLCRDLIYVDIQLSAFYGNEALSLSIINEYKMGEANAYRNLASLFSFLEDYNLTFEYVQIALEQFESLNDSAGIANAYITLGHTYRRQKNTSMEVLYHQKSYEIFDKLGDINRIGVSLHNLGESYLNDKNYEEALHYTTLAIKANTSNNNLSVLSSCYNVLGKIYLTTERFADAELAFKKVIYLSELLGENSQKIALSEAYLFLGELYRLLNQTDLIIEMLDKSIATAKYVNYNYAIKESYFIKIDYYINNNDANSAKESLLDFKIINDTLYLRQQKQIYNFSQVMINAINLRKDIERVSNEKQLLDKLVRSKNIQLVTTIVGIIIFSLLLFKLKKVNSKLLESNTLIERQNVFKTKLYSIFLHDLKSPLKFIYLITRQLYSITLSDKKYANEINSLFKSIINLSVFIEDFQTWLFKNQEIKLAVEYLDFRKLFYELSELYAPIALSANTSIQFESQDVLFKCQILPLKTVIRNLLDNAIKNTQSGFIYLENFKTNNYLNIKITDTGKGIDHTMLTTLLNKINHPNENAIIDYTPSYEGGMGYNYIADYLFKNDAIISIESEINVGTTIIISLPDKAKD
jgi:signal transduction histidine kinase